MKRLNRLQSHLFPFNIIESLIFFSFHFILPNEAKKKHKPEITQWQASNFHRAEVK